MVPAAAKYAAGRIAARRLIGPKKASCRIASSCQRTGSIISKYRTAVPATTPRSFSASALHDHCDELEPIHRILPVTTFTEDEEMVRDAARMWANQELKPLVRDMDNECKTRPEVIRGLFDHGFMGMVRFAWLQLYIMFVIKIDAYGNAIYFVLSSSFYSSTGNTRRIRRLRDELYFCLFGGGRTLSC